MVQEIQIEDGRRLIERLTSKGVEVAGAGWVKESEGGLWYLYLATSLVPEEGGKRAAYRRLHEVIDGLSEPLMIGPLEIKVVAPGRPVGKALRELAKRPASPPLMEVGEGRLGDLSIDAAFVYPRLPAPIG